MTRRRWRQASSCSARLAAIPAGSVTSTPSMHDVGGAHQPVDVVRRHAVRLDQYLDLRVDRPGPVRLHLGLVPADVAQVGGLPVEVVELVLTRLAQDEALHPQPDQRHDRRPADAAAARNQDPHGAQRALLLPAE